MEEDGLFDQSHVEDEPFDALPPPLSPGQEQTDPFGDGENGEVSKLADVPEAKRKGVKRPQPKLDSNRLISDRGLPALRTLFNDVRYKGKGHEAEDLHLLMKKMENWAHRLFPKLQFEDFIDKVERLGSKKEVQTCLKRIRLDMPLTHEDYMSKEGDQEEVPTEVQIFGDPEPFGGEHLSSSPPFVVHSTPASSAAVAQSDDLSLGTPPPSLPALTEEQRQRMEENRLKALERRLARQKQEQTESQSNESVPSESQSNESVPSESQSNESPPSESQSNESVPSESQSNESVPSESQSNESVPSDSQSNESPPSESQSNESVPSESQSNESPPSESQSNESPPSESQSNKSPPSESKSNESPPSDSQLVPVDEPAGELPQSVPQVPEDMEVPKTDMSDPASDEGGQELQQKQPPAPDRPLEQDKPETEPEEDRDKQEEQMYL